MDALSRRKSKEAVAIHIATASVVQWSEFLATGPEVPGMIPGVTSFSENQWVWNGFHSNL
jgi:hypothetical protein